MTIIIEEKKFKSFKKAVKHCEKEFGYEGEYWDIIVNSQDMYVLSEFISDEGYYSCVEENSY